MTISDDEKSAIAMAAKTERQPACDVIASPCKERSEIPRKDQ
jgi:hypothetical protein